MRPEIKQSVMYTTPDGKNFSVLTEAEKHMEIIDLFNALQGSDNYLGNIDVYALAEWLVANYEMYKKIPTP